MISLMGIEFRKLVRRKKFIIGTTMLFLMLFLCLGIIIFYAVDKMSPEKKIQSTKNYINTLEEQRKMQSDKGASTGVNAGYNKIIEDLKKDLGRQERMYDENIPWKDRIKEDIEYSREKIKRFSNSDSIKETESANILLKQYYLDNNIPYDYKEKLDFFSIIPQVLYAFGVFGVFIIVGIMVVDMISGENKPATIKFLLTKPIERWKFILSKFLVAVITINILVLGLEFICFTILGLILGFGDPNLPMIAGTTYSSVAPAYINELKAVVIPVIGSAALITKGALIIKVLILQSLGISACVAFCLLCSTIIQDSGTSTGVALFFISFTHIMMIYKNINRFDLKPPSIINKLLPYLFSTYYDGQAIITGEINKALGVTFINFNFAVMVMIGWIVICYAISHIIFTKKDFIA